VAFRGLLERPEQPFPHTKAGRAGRRAVIKVGRAQAPSFGVGLARLFVGGWGYVLLVAIRDRLCPAPGQEQVLVAPRTLVLRGGQVVARSTPAQHTVVWDGAEEQVTFLRD
jgi:hypothetical protein